LETEITRLEACEGDLGLFTPGSGFATLFRIEKELSKPENKELKKRWQTALRISAKIRLDLLHCKAFGLLEKYENKSSSSGATDIAFAKTMLSGVLAEDVEIAKRRYRPAASPEISGTALPFAGTQEDAVSDLEKEFDEGGE